MAAGRPPLTRRAWRGLMFLLLLLSGSAGAAGFQRGVNLSRWFEASAGAPVESRELRRLRDAGFDHVRIPVDPVALGWQPARGPRLTGTARLRAAIDTALAAGLDVIVDMHPSQDTKQSIESDAAWA
ncbi:cellulase family glycosylhydrolase, partial [Lysobacter sp. 2RAB21]